MARISATDISILLASRSFDPEWYLQEYPDVMDSGMSPAEHFLWIGARLGRRPVPPTSASYAGASGLLPPMDALDALFLDGTNGTSSTPYRVFRIAEGLAQEGWQVRCIKGEDLFTLNTADIRARYLVVHRAPYWSPYVEFVAQLRARGTIIIYDIDDLVFDDTVIPHIDGYKYLSDESKVGFLKGVRAYRDFILQADMCTTPTHFLTDRIRELGKPVYTVRNAISSENIRFFETVDYRRKGRPEPFVVGYYSGTKTHQADFAIVAPALIRFMREHPDVVFRLVGEFDLGEWPDLADWMHIHRPGDVPRVTRVGLMPHDTMIRDQFSCDLIIAPLEVGNPFCEAKSELKFFEASLAQVPTIVSATRTFQEATLNGILADLALTTEDWLSAMRRIYENYPTALKRAREAFFHVRYAYSQRFAATSALEAYEDFTACRQGIATVPSDTLPPPIVTADIGVIIPDFSGPSGGHRKIFTVCQALEKSGKRLKIYVYTNREPRHIKRDIVRLFGELDAEVAVYDCKVDAHAQIICTQWKSIYDFRSVAFAGRVICFVQDFEPMFYPVGSDYMRALVAYRLGYDIVCYGAWVAAKLEDELGLKPPSIPFTLDHNVYARPEVEEERDIDVLLFARPSQDRRCFGLISEGLVQLQQARPDVRIGLFGEEQYDEIDFNFTNYGIFSDVHALAALYRRAKIGICYSPTNPSQLGYEMVACGVCLIDVEVKYSDLNFGQDGFVRYCDGLPESMRGACLDLLDNAGDREVRQKRGYAFVQAMPADEELGPEFMRVTGLA